MIISAMTIAISSTLLTGNAAADPVQYDLRVDGLTCAFCIAASKKALKKIEGVTQFSVDLDTATISICAAKDVKFTDEQLTKLFKKKGFSYKSKIRKDVCTIGQKDKPAPKDES